MNASQFKQGKTLKIESLTDKGIFKAQMQWDGSYYVLYTFGVGSSFSRKFSRFTDAMKAFKQAVQEVYNA